MKASSGLIEAAATAFLKASFHSRKPSIDGQPPKLIFSPTFLPPNWFGAELAAAAIAEKFGVLAPSAPAGVKGGTVAPEVSPRCCHGVAPGGDLDSLVFSFG